LLNPTFGSSKIIYLTTRLIDWFFTVLRPAQEFFTYMEVTITGHELQNLGLCSALRAFEQGGISYCDTGPQFFRSHPKDRPIQSPLTTPMGLQKTHSNSDPHRAWQQGYWIKRNLLYAWY
jgi:hypothetical protein